MRERTMKTAGKVCTLGLSGEWGIEAAAELKEALLTCLAEAKEVVVDLDRLEETSLPCLQLLCSAHRTALSRGKRLTLSVRRPDHFSRAVNLSGFQRHTGCSWDRGRSCLWMKEEE
ncbi:MAG: STAS domain-containing protein [Thermodesulfobacteriota bacterium]